MPPAKKKRPRSYDPAKIRTAVLAQLGTVREGVRTLTAGQLELSAGPGTRPLSELVTHLATAMGAVARGLDEPEPRAGAGMAGAGIGAGAGADPVVALPEWSFAVAGGAGETDAGEISAYVGGLAQSAAPEELLTRVADRVEELLAGAPDDRLLRTGVGTMRLSDFLITRTVELVAFTDDVNRAAGLSLPFDRQALAACTRMLADALAVKAPGASTEVRIPPYAVVQCVEGPRHTRGTPPNVVETDPLTWVRLATGRTSWHEALEAAQVSASGERADLSGLLPLTT